MTCQVLTWEYGRLEVQSLGGMLGPVAFGLPGGRTVSPLHVAPWADDLSLPGILRRLRGEWPCVPFGFDAPRDLPPQWTAMAESFAAATLPHGHAAHHCWTFIDTGPTHIEMRYDYPEDHPIRALSRTITPDPKAPAIDIRLTVHARRSCRMPLGLHPTFRLPGQIGALEVCPGKYAGGRTFPIPVESTSRLAPDTPFANLSAIPTISGDTLSLSCLPLALDTEELVQLLHADGSMVLRYGAEGFQARLTWDAGHFPSVLLWVSNRGRTSAPWDGTHLALGVEPVASAFDLGPAVSNAPNPISEQGCATTISLSPDTAFVTSYRIAAEPLRAS